MESGSKARQIMEAQGWQSGDGLGRHGDGRTVPIKASLKFDQSGLGHDRAREFTHHWWDLAFNRAAQAIQVTRDSQGEINLNMDRPRTKKEKRVQKQQDKSNMYAMFVPAGTLTNGRLVQPASDASADESEAEEKLPPTLNQLTDEELFRACGGLTAHKGARHGHKMSGKQNRIEAMEAKWLAEMQEKAKSLEAQAIEAASKKKKKSKTQPIEASIEQDENQIANMDHESVVSVKKKKKKKKALANREVEHSVNPTPLEPSDTQLEGTKKKKRKREERSEEDLKVKKKKKRDLS